MKKQLSLVVIVILLGVILVSQNSSSEDVISIGVIGPFTGALASHGEWMKRGIEMAAQDMQDINGKEIKVIFEDTKCLPAQTQSSLSKLAFADGISAFIGPFCGSPTTIAGKFAGEQGIVGISPSATNFGKISPNFFNTQSLIDNEAKVMADHAYHTMRLDKIAIYYFNNDWGLKLGNAFDEEFTRLGGEITYIDKIQSFDQSDHRTQLIKSKDSGAQAIYVAFSAIGQIINQARELDIDLPILSQNGMENPDVLGIAGDNANGVVYTFRGDEDALTRKQELFIEEYVTRFDEYPGPIVADAYDALFLIKEALETCGEDTSADCHASVISHTTDFDGVSGLFSIDPEDHDVNKPVTIKTIVNGGFVGY